MKIKSRIRSKLQTLQILFYFSYKTLLMTYDSKGIVAFINQLSITNVILKKLFFYLEQSQDPVIILTIHPGGCQALNYTGWLAQHTGIVCYQLHRLVSSVYRYSGIPATQAG